VPLMFGVQQFCEGLVWVGVGRRDAGLTQSAALAFLFFALAFWLFWIPFSAIFLERRRKIQLVLGFCTLVGFIAGAVQLIPVVADPDSIRVTVVHHSIRYDFADPPSMRVVPHTVWHVFYLAIIAMPLVLLKNKTLILYSTGLVVSAVISHLFFWHAFPSMWCFCAAALSIYLAFLFRALPPQTTVN
jgi:hypothetical protein